MVQWKPMDTESSRRIYKECWTNMERIPIEVRDKKRRRGSEVRSKLLRTLINTAAETTTAFGADPRLVRNQRRLRELKERTLIAVSRVEFDALRYSLEHANHDTE